MVSGGGLVLIVDIAFCADHHLLACRIGSTYHNLPCQGLGKCLFALATFTLNGEWWTGGPIWRLRQRELVS